MYSPPSALPRGILLTNDDGPPGKFAPFLLPFTRALKRRLRQLHSQSATAAAAAASSAPPALFVCVPSDQQSWVGKAITRFAQVTAHTNFPPPTAAAASATSAASAASEPAAAPSVPAAAYCTSEGDDVSLWSSVDGTPSTTANVALHTLAPFPVDLCVSGPNLGRNTGRSFVLSSGTVGAALECAFAGVRSVAVSFAYFDKLHVYSAEQIDCASEVAVDVVLALWAEWGDGVEVYNVNVPLGCARDARVYHTHLLQDHYGAVYAPTSHSLLAHNQPASADRVLDDSVAQELQAGPLPLPSAASLPAPQPSLNGITLQAAPTAPVAVPGVGSEVAELSHSVSYKFNISMREEWSRLAQYEGSDFMVTKSGSVSVSALKGSFIECDWRSARYGRYGAAAPQNGGTDSSGSDASQRKSAL